MHFFNAKNARGASTPAAGMTSYSVDSNAISGSHVQSLDPTKTQIAPNT
jgi:hypothetical protein